MIRFATKPDSLFCELLNCAITDTVENYLTFDDRRDQEEWLCACMPRGERFFTASQAREHFLASRMSIRITGSIRSPNITGCCSMNVSKPLPDV